MNPWHLTVWLLPVCLLGINGPWDVALVSVVAIAVVLVCRAFEAGRSAA